MTEFNDDNVKAYFKAEGTVSGRFDSTKPNRSAKPKSLVLDKSEEVVESEETEQE